MENNKLGSSIAVMNAKGGVGKSTVTLAMAETLSYYHDKKVLVIDSDAQMSISVMLMPFDILNNRRANWKTLVGLLHKTLILGQTPDWKEVVAKDVSDVDEADTIHLLPGDLRLTLVERAVTEADRHEQMRSLVRSILAEAALEYDYILIDCPPGLSLLTEIWLRESDYHLAPVKPDFLAIAGLEMFREFKNINPDLKMARNLGILVNMKHNNADDEKYHNILATDAESNCFPMAIPHMLPIQHAARYQAGDRSYSAKYPGSAGKAFRITAQEILQRTAEQLPVREPEVPVASAPQAQPLTAPAPVAAPSPAPTPQPAASVPVAVPTQAPPKLTDQLQTTVGGGDKELSSVVAGIAARFAPDANTAVAVENDEAAIAPPPPVKKADFA